MPQPPDVTAYNLPTALAALAAAGWPVAEPTVTQPPRALRGLGTPRVARQRVAAPGVIELVVVYPAYERPPRDGRVRHRNQAG